MAVYRLYNEQALFPSPYEAEPDGLLAIGGKLSPDFLLAAYSQGIFPWYGEGAPRLWWSPAPRFVILPETFHVPQSVKKILRRNDFEFTLDKDFRGVITACSAPRAYTQNTWLVPEMVEAYTLMHDLGLAHSVEAWQNGQLVGGAYGITPGKCFCGESMFYHVPNASKVAFVYLANVLWEAGFHFIDCQQVSAHMERFGAVSLARDDFMERLHVACQHPIVPCLWQGGLLL